MIRPTLAILAFAAASACSSPEQMSETIAQGRGGDAQEMLERRVPADAVAGALSIENDTYEFAYRWPREAAAIPELNAFMQDRAKQARARFASDAQKAAADASEFGYPYRPHTSEWNWEVAADTPRLLVLVAGSYFYTGGAHGNSTFDALVWDREARPDALETRALFTDVPAFEEAVLNPYCKALGPARLERIGEAGLGTAIEDICPLISELTVSFATSDGKTIDRIVLLSAPYVVGSYAEGSYEIEVPVTDDILALIRPEYRDQFSLAD